MNKLSSLDPVSFIRYAKNEAYVLPGEYYKPSRNRNLDETKTLSFEEFIYCIYKYTDHWKSEVHLDAEIVENDERTCHQLVIWGIRDPGIREHKHPQYFPGRQEGVWDYVLEEALKDGLAAEEVHDFRQTLNLIPKYGIYDKDFFHKLTDLRI